MNHTRWTALAQALDGVGDNGPLVSIKYIDREAVDGPSHIHWQEFLQQGSDGCAWLDIHGCEPVHRGRLLAPALLDHSQAIQATLKQLGQAFSQEKQAHNAQGGPIFRVWGYVDGRQPPELLR
jgi:hypothetical protein